MINISATICLNLEQPSSQNVVSLQNRPATAQNTLSLLLKKCVLGGKKHKLAARCSQVEVRTPAAGVLHAFETFAHISQNLASK